jgi:hypothetical protein
MRGTREFQHPLLKLQDEIRIKLPETDEEDTDRDEGKRIVLHGVLDFAAAASNQIKIYELVGGKKKNPRSVQVPAGLEEIVRNYFGEAVRAHCLFTPPGKLELIDIFPGA